MNKKVRVITAAGGALALLAVGFTTADASSAPTPKAGVSVNKFTPAIAPTYHATSESTFVPLAPCRIVDTRSGGGALVSNAIRSFIVRGTAGFTGQGGHSGGCGVPSYASAVTANVTIPHPAGGGYMTGYPAGSTPSTTNFVTYLSAQTLTVNPTFTLAAPGTEPSLSIKNVGHTADVIIDVTGYYAPQKEAMITPSAGVYAGSDRVASASHIGTGYFSVTFDQDVTACSPHASTYYNGYYATVSALSGNTVYVNVWYLNSGTYTAADTYFYVTVTC